MTNRNLKVYPVTYVVNANTRVDFLLRNLNLNTINDEIGLASSRLQVALPLLDRQKLVLLFKDNTGSRSSRIDLGNEVGRQEFECFKLSDKQEISIQFHTVITISLIDTSSVPKCLYQHHFYSGVSAEMCYDMINTVFKKRPESNGMNLCDACFTSEGDPLNVTVIGDLLEGWEYTFFTGYRKSGYSKATFLQVRSKVDFHFGDGIKPDFKTDSTMGYLKAFEKTIESSMSPLSAAIEKAKTSIYSSNQAEQWKKLVTDCVLNLSKLNRIIMHAEMHSEAARRLIINEVIKEVVYFNQGTFYVEEYQNTRGDPDPKYIGWGPLDFTINNVILDTVEEEEEKTNSSSALPNGAPWPEWEIIRTTADVAEEEECEVQKAASKKNRKSADDGGGSGSSSSSTGSSLTGTEASVQQETVQRAKKRSHTVEEAKHTLNDRALFQACSQGYDRMYQPQFEHLQRVSIILSTGHAWKYFVLFKTIRKAKLIYCGEVNMRVLRGTQTLDGPADKKHRLSCCRKDQYDVSREEVETVMLSLHCSMNEMLEIPIP